MASADVPNGLSPETDWARDRRRGSRAAAEGLVEPRLGGAPRHCRRPVEIDLLDHQERARRAREARQPARTAGEVRATTRQTNRLATFASGRCSGSPRRRAPDRPHRLPRPHAEIVHLQEPEHDDCEAHEQQERSGDRVSLRRAPVVREAQSRRNRPLTATLPRARGEGGRRAATAASTPGEHRHHHGGERELDLPHRPVRPPGDPEPSNSAPHTALSGVTLRRSRQSRRVAGDLGEVAAVAREQHRQIEHRNGTMPTAKPAATGRTGALGDHFAATAPASPASPNTAG